MTDGAPAATFRAACVQTNSAREFADNLGSLRDLVVRARDGGAEMIFTPENATMMEPSSQLMRAKAPREQDHPALPLFTRLARELEAWIALGSLTVKLDDDGRLANRSIVIDARGDIVARYDKIHLFDVDLGAAEQYRESASIASGSEAVVVPTPWGRLGLSVCYDLRFPHLYRALARAGADFLAIPAAFTRTTGVAHWRVLQRARAIENGCYVFAAAQCGIHAEGRETFGHSMIVDPWGVELADGGEDVGIVFADVDPARVAEARRRIPSLRHDRPFTVRALERADATP